MRSNAESLVVLRRRGNIDDNAAAVPLRALGVAAAMHVAVVGAGGWLVFVVAGGRAGSAPVSAPASPFEKKRLPISISIS